MWRFTLKGIAVSAALWAALFWIMSATGSPFLWWGAGPPVEDIAGRLAVQATWNTWAAYCAAIAAFGQAFLLLLDE